jgi:diguanylate cyclase (GGDEF)-like protein
MPPSAVVASVRRRELALLAALLALYVAMPWLVLPLERLWAAPRVAVVGQTGEMVLGLLLGAWVFGLIRRQRRLVRELQLTVEDLTQADPLTGLGNLRAFARELDLALNRSRRTHEPVAILFLDVRDMDHVNRRHGRPVGDQTLRMMGAVLRSSARFGSDAGYRVGGDEFALVVTARREIAESVGRRIDANFQERSPRHSRVRYAVAAWDGRASAQDLLDQARRTLSTSRDGALTAQFA